MPFKPITARACSELSVWKALQLNLMFMNSFTPPMMLLLWLLFGGLSIPNSFHRKSRYATWVLSGQWVT
jgi:hypothetical protein|tara:strand:+ start:1119 stop:1325 length:207 start_codon:yes stop_codon:yes gene_type:complete